MFVAPLFPSAVAVDDIVLATTDSVVVLNEAVATDVIRVAVAVTGVAYEPASMAVKVLNSICDEVTVVDDISAAKMI